ncbi:hypothetical protein LC082_06270 [Microbacterium esteraromaticum]|uniref:hypothetical protein n=1 Tax=Microbacterium esteraromaticum TaxID=57043 RepID=UPI001CD3BA9B|nr:hypothetical protein [Microbacterium esteraromaticum]MCA1306500.1 hypothetical protein [Microbacterium esteraromaticum]
MARKSSEAPDSAPDLAAQVEVWKKIVEVQQHFNDIGWRIRGLAMTALTFTLGATFFGYLNADPVTVGSLGFSPAAFVPVLGFLLWALFWFADGIWYHRLLSGAGAAAAPVEEKLKEHGITADLSTEIQNASHLRWLCWEMNSTRKLHLFYGAGAVILVITALALLLMTGDRISIAVPLPAPSATP